MRLACLACVALACGSSPPAPSLGGGSDAREHAPAADASCAPTAPRYLEHGSGLNAEANSEGERVLVHIEDIASDFERAVLCTREPLADEESTGVHFEVETIGDLEANIVTEEVQLATKPSCEDYDCIVCVVWILDRELHLIGRLVDLEGNRPEIDAGVLTLGERSYVIRDGRLVLAP